MTSYCVISATSMTVVWLLKRALLSYFDVNFP